MSSILEALKKLEEERSRRRESAPEIATSILRGDGRRQHGLPWLGLALGVGGLALLVVGWAFWPRNTVAPVALDTAPAPPAVVTASVPPPRRELVLEEVLDTRVPPAPQATVVTPVAARVVKAPPPTAVTASTALTTPAVSIPPTGAALTVSAIVYQDESSTRMAVVNDLPVMIGEIVGDARVVDIQRDRVLFSRNGTTFSVIPQ